MWTSVFWKDTTERAVFTFAEALLGFFLVAGTTLLSMDWGAALAVSATAAVVTVLKAIVASGKGGTISPASAVNDERVL